MHKRTYLLIAPWLLLGLTSPMIPFVDAQEIVIVPVLNSADGQRAALTPSDDDSSSPTEENEPMIRIAQVAKKPTESKSDSAPKLPPAPIVRIVENDRSGKRAVIVVSDRTSEKDATAEQPVEGNTIEILADTLSADVDSPNDDSAKEDFTQIDNEETSNEKSDSQEPAPLKQDESATPIRKAGDPAGAKQNEDGKEETAADEDIENKDSDSSDPGERTSVSKPEIILPPELEIPAAAKALRPQINRVLDYYYKNQPVDATRDDVWEAMHGFLPFGVDSQMRTAEYPQLVNAIGWICWNKPCRGHKLFVVNNGQLEARQGPRVQGHHGQFLAMLAQSYVPSSFEIRVDGQTFTVADLIEFEKATCKPKTELTFKLIALSHYLPADATWMSNDGREWSLERLLEEEIQQKVVGAACGGTHRLTGIAFAVAARKEAGLPMDGVWAKADQYLQQYHKHTFMIQNPDGSFSTKWFEGRGMDRDIDRRLQTSGHILEFMVFSLPREELTSPKMIKAVSYLASIMETGARRPWKVGPKGHALHALVLYDQLVFGTKPGSRGEAEANAEATSSEVTEQ